MEATRQFDVEVDELPPITASDLRHFDQEAVDLVMEFQDKHGWTGWISGNQHVILRAPDGDGTASISRKWRAKRSAEIMRRPLDQWLRRKEREREETERKNAFGLSTTEGRMDMESPEPPWHIATKQSYDALLRMQKRTRDWWDGVRLAGSGMTVWLLHEQGEDNWVLISGSRKDKMTHIAAVGPEADPEMVQHFKDLTEANNRKGIAPMDTTGPLTGKKHPCLEPECGRSFDTQGALNLHKQKHVKVDLTCPLCPRVLHTPAAFGRHLRSNLHKHDPRLAAALESRHMPPEGGRPGPKLGAERECEYGCPITMPGMSLGGHHRAHKKLGHVKVADGGDGATQVMKTSKVITAPVSPPEVPEAATEAPVKPEPLVVQAAPIAVVTAPVAVNGTGHSVMPADLLNQVRALVNPEMVGDLERLRTRNTELEQELETVTRDRDDLKAWKDMMKEAMNA